MREKLRFILLRWEIQMLLTLAFLVLYLWPLLTSAPCSVLFGFVYYYTVFSFNIVALFAVARALGSDDEQQHRRTHDD